MTVRTRILAHGNATVGSGGQWILFQCPSDRTAILKSVCISGTAPAVNQAGETEVDDGSGNVVRTAQFNVSSTSVHHVEGLFIVLEEGDQFAFRNTGGLAVGIRWHLSGALLEGDPS